MSQIKVKLLKQGTPSDKVLSCSFFTMKDSYKSFSKYAFFLKHMIEKSRDLTGFETRIYTDDTGSDIALKVAEKYENVSVYHFDCPAFREGDGHTGTFGTIVRFLPMFESGLKFVWISDIDVVRERNWFTDSFVSLASKYDLFSETRVCYNAKPWTFGHEYPFIAFRMTFTVTFPKRLLTHYLNMLIQGKLSEHMQIVNEYNSRKTPNQRFPYGMDEYFMNSVIHDYVKRNSMKCLFRKEYDLSGWFLHLESGLTKKDKDIISAYKENPTKENLKRVVPVYRKGIPMFEAKDKCVLDVLQKLDSFKNEMVEWIEVSGKDI
jgi:hypothetical protein